MTEDKQVLVGNVTYAAGTGEDHLAFLADESDPEEFCEAMARGCVMKAILDGSTWIIPAASIRRCWFGKTTFDARRHKAAEIEFYERG